MQKCKIYEFQSLLQKYAYVAIIFLIILLIVPTASAELTAESAEISYQVEHSDRIAVGKVTEIQRFYDYSIVTIEIKEWLMNPISSTEIKIQTKIGTNVDTEDEPRFTVSESAILMLTDADLENNTFQVTVGEPGKHSLSDLDEIVNEISKIQSAQNHANLEDDAEKHTEYTSNPVTLSNGSDYALDMDDDRIPVDESHDDRIATMITSLIAFGASIIFVFLLVKKAAHEPNSRRTYLIFFLIGIFTFYLSGYILRGIDPPQPIYLMFLVFFVLTGTGILATGERSGMFVAKAFAISFAALVIISVLFFAYGAFSHMYSKSIDADLLSEKPDNFIVVTDEELKNYPTLKEAIETQSPVDANPWEWERTIEFLNGTYTVKYKGEYYKIDFTTA